MNLPIPIINILTKDENMFRRSVPLSSVLRITMLARGPDLSNLRVCRHHLVPNGHAVVYGNCIILPSGVPPLSLEGKELLTQAVLSVMGQMPHASETVGALKMIKAKTSSTSVGGGGYVSVLRIKRDAEGGS